VSAIGGTCGHWGGPLAEGELVDGCVECPWHGSRFRWPTAASRAAAPRRRSSLRRPPGGRPARGAGASVDSRMPVDVLEQGRSRARAVARSHRGVVVAGTRRRRGRRPAGPRSSAAGAGRRAAAARPARARERPEPAAGTRRAAAPAASRWWGVPRAALLSTAVELPGSDVVLLPTPDRLTDDGAGLLVLTSAPVPRRGWRAVPRAEVRAVVRARVRARRRTRSASPWTRRALADACERGAAPDRSARLRTTAVAWTARRGSR
jgi:hypothetical protein